MSCGSVARRAIRRVAGGWLGSRFRGWFDFNNGADRGIVLTGGGANSDTWRQVVADVFNVPVTVLQNNEGAALGAALQALAMLEGSAVNIEKLTGEHLARDEALCCEPRSSAVNFYNESYNEYQLAVEKVAALYS